MKTHFVISLDIGEQSKNSSIINFINENINWFRNNNIYFTIHLLDPSYNGEDSIKQYEYDELPKLYDANGKIMISKGIEIFKFLYNIKHNKNRESVHSIKFQTTQPDDITARMYHDNY